MIDFWDFGFNFDLTRHDVPKPDGRHGDEAEVECVEEAPVLPYREDAASDAEEEGQVGQGQEGRQGVAAETAVVIVVVFFSGALWWTSPQLFYIMIPIDN